jgi:hypothetical protein
MEIIALLPATAPLTLTSTCRLFRRACEPFERMYVLGSVPCWQDVVNRSWIHRVTHLRASRIVTILNYTVQAIQMVPLHMSIPHTPILLAV